MALNAHYTPIYRDDELRFGLLNACFADKPHPISVAYDAAVDKLLVWLIEPGPKVLASEFFVTEDKAFLVRDDDQEVIGFTIEQFQEVFLAAAPQLAGMWRLKGLASRLDGYQRLEYQPVTSSHDNGSLDVARIINYSAFQAKSAREISLA